MNIETRTVIVISLLGSLLVCVIGYIIYYILNKNKIQLDSDYYRYYIKNDIVYKGVPFSIIGNQVRSYFVIIDTIKEFDSKVIIKYIKNIMIKPANIPSRVFCLDTKNDLNFIYTRSDLLKYFRNKIPSIFHFNGLDYDGMVIDGNIVCYNDRVFLIKLESNKEGKIQCSTCTEVVPESIEFGHLMHYMK